MRTRSHRLPLFRLFSCQEENAVRAGDLDALRGLLEVPPPSVPVMSLRVANMTTTECARYLRVKASIAGVAEELRWIRENMNM